MKSKLRRILTLVALALFAVLSVPAAHATVCTANTLQFYLNTYGGDTYANNCTVGGEEFTGFIFNEGYGINNSGTTPTSWGPTGDDASDASGIEVTPIADTNGAGFEISLINGPVSASAGGVTDLGFAFAVLGNITKVYTEVNGALTGNGDDNLTEQFCTQTSAPSAPDAFIPPSCSQTLFNTLTNPTTDHVDTFTAPASTDYITVGKDISVSATEGGTATLNFVKDQFGPAVSNVPEPASLTIFGTTVLGLVLIGLVRRRRKSA